MAAVLDAEFLSAAEVKTLTGASGTEEQARVLTRDGVPFRQRGNRLLVSRFHTREWLAGRVVTPSRGINLSAVK